MKHSRTPVEVAAQLEVETLDTVRHTRAGLFSAPTWNIRNSSDRNNEKSF